MDGGGAKPADWTKVGRPYTTVGFGGEALPITYRVLPACVRSAWRTGARAPRRRSNHGSRRKSADPPYGVNLSPRAARWWRIRPSLMREELEGEGVPFESGGGERGRHPILAGKSGGAARRGHISRARRRREQGRSDVVEKKSRAVAGRLRERGPKHAPARSLADSTTCTWQSLKDMWNDIIGHRIEQLP